MNSILQFFFFFFLFSLSNKCTTFLSKVPFFFYISNFLSLQSTPERCIMYRLIIILINSKFGDIISEDSLRI